MCAKSFVKWVGGKGGSVNRIKEYIPSTVDTYYEVFVGGGALFFSIVDGGIRCINLSDSNEDLMLTYGVIQKDVHALIEKLEFHQKEHSREYYYLVRSQHRLLDSVSRAARFIYLNKTCYNGLFRVNRKGEFNVPMGRYANPSICDVKNLKAVSCTLQGVKLFCCSFEDVVVEKNSFVYCDPPYHKTYNQYSEEGFDGMRQCRLHEKVLEWIKRGCKVVISNNDTELIRKLYREDSFILHEMVSFRAISCKSIGRGVVSELLIESR